MNQEIPENITRFDYHHTHGWWFRMSHDFNKKFSKLFSDSKYGGRDNALKAAIVFRAKYIARESATKRPTKSNRLHFKRSKFNLIGVRLLEQKNNLYWASSIMVDGKQKVRMWSIHKWGYEMAYRNARSERLTYATDQKIPLKPPKLPDELRMYL